jgi:hypothetical protein
MADYLQPCTTCTLSTSQGTQGPAGVGISSVTINGSNELVITLTNGTVLNQGVVVGAAGAAGANGTDGTLGGFTIEYLATGFNRIAYADSAGQVQTQAADYTSVGSNIWWFNDLDANGNDISETNTFYDAVVAETYDKIYVKIFDLTDSSKMQLYEGLNPTSNGTGDLGLDMTHLGGSATWNKPTDGNNVGVSFVFVKNGAAGANGSNGTNGTNGTSIIYSDFTKYTDLTDIWQTISVPLAIGTDITTIGDYLDIDVEFTHEADTADSNTNYYGYFKLNVGADIVEEDYIGTPQTDLKRFKLTNLNIGNGGKNYIYKYSMNIKVFYNDVANPRVMAQFHNDLSNDLMQSYPNGNRSNISCSTGTGDLAALASIDLLYKGNNFSISAISIKAIKI